MATNGMAAKGHGRRLATWWRSMLLVLCAWWLPAMAATAQDSVLTVALPDGQQLEMAWVEGGTFIMGSNDGRGAERHYEASAPEHRVSLDSYFMGRYEVTQGQWRAVMGSNPSKFEAADGQADSLPVEQVSWVEAQQFVALLSQLTGRRFRLPTEAEWEYAARGGRRSHGTAFAGSSRKQLESAAWFCTNSGGHTHAVGRLAPNELGLHDMCGNVAEWCADWMDGYTVAEQRNPRGPATGESRILRGGHYNSTSPGCAVFDRGWYVPTGKTEYYGLRVVMEADSGEEETD